MSYFVLLQDAYDGSVRLLSPNLLPTREEALEAVGTALRDDPSLRAGGVFLAELGSASPILFVEPGPPEAELDFGEPSAPAGQPSQVEADEPPEESAEVTEESPVVATAIGVFDYAAYDATPLSPVEDEGIEQAVDLEPALATEPVSESTAESWQESDVGEAAAETVEADLGESLEAGFTSGIEAGVEAEPSEADASAPLEPVLSPEVVADAKAALEAQLQEPAEEPRAAVEEPVEEPLAEVEEPVEEPQAAVETEGTGETAWFAAVSETVIVSEEVVTPAAEKGFVGLTPWDVGVASGPDTAGLGTPVESEAVEAPSVTEETVAPEWTEPVAGEPAAAPDGSWPSETIAEDAQVLAAIASLGSGSESETFAPAPPEADAVAPDVGESEAAFEVPHVENAEAALPEPEPFQWGTTAPETAAPETVESSPAAWPWVETSAVAEELGEDAGGVSEQEAAEDAVIPDDTSAWGTGEEQQPEAALEEPVAEEQQVEEAAATDAGVEVENRDVPPTEPAVPIGPAYEPGADLDLSRYTCDDCVYVNTCPKVGESLPAQCGSFQWRSS